MSRVLAASSLPASVRAKLPKQPKQRAAKEALAQLRRISAESRQDAFYAMLKRARLPLPVAEFRFDPERMWRFDYCWPAHKIALEVEGGVFSGGRHTRGVGFLRDIEKYNAAAVHGYRLLRTVPDRLTGNAIEHALRQLLKPSARAL